jgi:hypothetical protein
MRVRHFSMFALLLASLLGGVSARAHSDSQSSLHVSIGPGRITAEWSLLFRDFATWVPAGDGGYGDKVIARLREERGQLLELRGDDELIAPEEVVVRSPMPGVVTVHFAYAIAGEPSDLEVRCLCLDRLPVGHHQVMTVEDRREGRVGELIDQQTICVEQDTAVVELPLLAGSAKKPRQLKLVAKGSADDAGVGSLPVRAEPVVIPAHVSLVRPIMVLWFAVIAGCGWLGIRAYWKGKIR